MSQELLQLRFSAICYNRSLYNRNEENLIKSLNTRKYHQNVKVSFLSFFLQISTEVIITSNFSPFNI